MFELFDQIEESANFLEKKLGKVTNHALILGTGLGNLPDRIRILKDFSYKLIPHFMPSTVEGHAGKLLLAEWKSKPILLLSGRLHYYEGYTTQEVTFPIRVLKQLGIQNLWITNASGTVNPAFQAGDIVFVEDHINFHPQNPLRGIYDPRMGDRFPDMSEVYNRDFLRKAEESCKALNIPFRKGIYFGLQGPSLETPAEYRMIRMLGADIVGMSTVPEVIVAHQSKMNIMAASVVTNSTPDQAGFKTTTIESVLKVIHESSGRLFDVLEHMLG